MGAKWLTHDKHHSASPQDGLVLWPCPPINTWPYSLGKFDNQKCRQCRPLCCICWQCCCRRFQCNLCGMVCECPPEYFCTTDGQGKRMDYHQRPELSQGSVEFIAPQEYMVCSQLTSVQSCLTCIGCELCCTSRVHGTCPLNTRKAAVHLCTHESGNTITCAVKSLIYRPLRHASDHRAPQEHMVCRLSTHECTVQTHMYGF